MMRIPKFDMSKAGVNGMEDGVIVRAEPTYYVASYGITLTVNILLHWGQIDCRRPSGERLQGHNPAVVPPQLW